MGNYLVYRQLDKEYRPPRGARLQGVVAPAEPVKVPSMFVEETPGSLHADRNLRSAKKKSRNTDPPYYGDDLDDLPVGFLHGGLVKKTMSVGTLHLVAYYSSEDVYVAALSILWQESLFILNPSCQR